MVKYVMKQHDLAPALEIQLLDGTTPVPLTSAVSATFIMKNRAGTKVHRAMAIPDQTLFPGVVRLPWILGDTDTVANYDAEVEVIWPGGLPQTFPANRYLAVEIQKDLG